MEEVLHPLIGSLQGFDTSQVVQDFFHQQCGSFMKGSLCRVISRIVCVFFLTQLAKYLRN